MRIYCASFHPAMIRTVDGYTWGVLQAGHKLILSSFHFYQGELTDGKPTSLLPPINTNVKARP